MEALNTSTGKDEQNHSSYLNIIETRATWNFLINIEHMEHSILNLSTCLKNYWSKTKAFLPMKMKDNLAMQRLFF